MRVIFFSFFLICITAIAFSQKKVGVFYVSLRLEEPFVNDLYLANPSNGVQNRFSKTPVFPQYLLDSLNKEILRFVSLISKGKSHYVYKITPSNDTIVTISGGELEGFPRNSKKAAMLLGYDEYLDVRFTLLSRGGSEVTMSVGKPSKFKPSMLVTIVSFDKMGVRQRTYKYNFTEFIWKSDNRKSIYTKAVVDRRSGVLHPEDLYILFRCALEMTEDKILGNE
jgi:hypothetical protein